MRLIILFLITAFCSACGVQSLEKFKDLKSIEIQYEALSRGFFENISISNAGISLRIDRHNEHQKLYKIAKQDWQICLNLLEKLNLDDLPKLKAPTSKRFYDGAAHALLSVEINGEKMTTPSFDHGYPPKAIKNLIEHILSLKKYTASENF